MGYMCFWNRSARVWGRWESRQSRPSCSPPPLLLTLSFYAPHPAAAFISVYLHLHRGQTDPVCYIPSTSSPASCTSAYVSLWDSSLQDFLALCRENTACTSCKRSTMCTHRGKHRVSTFQPWTGNTACSSEQRGRAPALCHLYLSAFVTWYGLSSCMHSDIQCI